MYRYKEKSCKRAPIPKLIDNQLEVWDYEIDQQIGQSYDIRKPHNLTYWQLFLDTNTSFRYEQGNSSFTAIKEKRKGSKKHPLRGNREIYIWYAHKRINNILYRRYLGHNERITAMLLAAVDFSGNENKKRKLSDQERMKRKAHKAVNENSWEDSPWRGRCATCNTPTNNLVAHHWTGYNEENFLNVWWVCYRCNSYLPHDGRMTIPEARKFIKEDVCSYHF